VFVFRKVVFEKLVSKFFCVCLPLEKLINGKFGLVFRKVFSFYFGRKTLSGSCEKFRNVILFADYIKFRPQTFNYYIYFILNICFSIWSSFFWLLLILFEIIYEKLIIIILISSSFNFLFFRFNINYLDYYLFYLK
jgi:hypothetical protein